MVFLGEPGVSVGSLKGSIYFFAQTGGACGGASGVGSGFREGIPGQVSGSGISWARVPCLGRGHGDEVSISTSASRSDTGARKEHGPRPVRSSDARMRMIRPVFVKPQNIWLPGPPFARNHALRRWIRK